MFASLEAINKNLSNHPLFSELNSPESLRLFMEAHVFAVWDFMSLLKRLQRELTCVDVPWRPSRVPAELTRLINQIVLGEESDLDLHGNPTSHFDLYLKAMKEVGASVTAIESFLESQTVADIPNPSQSFTKNTLKTATQGHIVEVAASFFYGREKLIPSMFHSVVEVLNAHKLDCPTLIYYLERHIALDGDEHGPMGERCLELLCGGDERLLKLAQNAGLHALKAREELWDQVLGLIRGNGILFERQTPALQAESLA